MNLTHTTTNTHAHKYAHIHIHTYVLIHTSNIYTHVCVFRTHLIFSEHVSYEPALFPVQTG